VIGGSWASVETQANIEKGDRIMTKRDKLQRAITELLDADRRMVAAIAQERADQAAGFLTAATITEYETAIQGMYETRQRVVDIALGVKS
jgi:hypothetical protein